MAKTTAKNKSKRGGGLTVNDTVVGTDPGKQSPLVWDMLCDDAADKGPRETIAMGV